MGSPVSLDKLDKIDMCTCLLLCKLFGLHSNEIPHILPTYLRLAGGHCSFLFCLILYDVIVQHGCSK